MNNINSRGTWLVSRFALPHLLKSAAAARNPHILTYSPPLTHSMLAADATKGCWPQDFSATASAYTLAKFGMSLVTLALAAETRGKIGVNALWPYTLIGTSAMKIVSKDPQNEERKWRSPEIMSEASIRVFQEDASKFT